MWVPESYLSKRATGARAGAGEVGISRGGSEAGDPALGPVLFADIASRVGKSVFLSVKDPRLGGTGYQQLNEELDAVQTHRGVFTPLYSALLVGCPARSLLLGGSIRDVPGFENDTKARFLRGEDTVQLATVLMVTFLMNVPVRLCIAQSQSAVLLCACLVQVARAFV